MLKGPGENTLLLSPDGLSACTLTILFDYIQIFCSLKGEDKLVSVRETETCNYLLHVETPLLCSHPLFVPSSTRKPQDLSCSPVVSEEEFQRFTERQGEFIIS